MKVSVAMTTYNGEKYVEKQLLSLLNQDRHPDEVIICDDCSKDATVRIVREFLEHHRLDHWKLICNETNLGYVKNFKKVMALTTGDLVFLCDQDDIWLPTKIWRGEELLIQNPRILALACDYQTIDGADLLEAVPKLARRGLTKPNADALSMVRQGVVLYSNIAQGCACVYRREIVDAYCATQKAEEFPHDWAMNLLAYEEGGLFFLHEALLHYRIHENNTVGIISREQAVRNRIPSLQKYKEEISQAKMLAQSPQSRMQLEKVEAFTQVRITWLQEKRLSVWLNGFLRYFPVVCHCFFWQYMKDLALGMMNQVPAKDTK